MYGYIGKYLFVDLSSNHIEERELPQEWARDFIGGAGLGARILWDLMPAKTPVFDEKSVIGFVCGAFNGTPAFYGGRWTVVSKSPYNDRWNDANSGGYFGVMLRRSGYDALFVTGKSERPVYIYINNGKAEIRDAEFLMGLTLPDADSALKKAISDHKFSYAMIGVGGENMAYSSAVMNDEHRAAARGGSAAIMGSKKLKAIVCTGTHKVSIYDTALMNELNRQTRQNFLSMPISSVFSTHGTSNSNMGAFQNGDAWVKNWSASLEDSGTTIEDYSTFSADYCDSRYKVEPWGCASCPTRCGAIMRCDEGSWPMRHFARPEFESAGIFGPGMLNKDVHAMFRCNEICNLYGMDTIAIGGTVAWAMEAYSEGALTIDQLDGIDLRWGNAEAMVEMTERVCRGEGCGAVLMHGSKYAADNWGVGQEFLAVAGNLELPAHDSRRLPGFARSFYADPSPGRHVKGSMASTGFEAKLTMEERWDPNRITGFLDIVESGVIEYGNNAGFCRFGLNIFMPRSVLFGLYPALTGFEFGDLQQFLTMKRTFTMRQAFNLREGYTRRDYSISPKVIGLPPLKDGANKGLTVDIERITNNLYNAMGYDYDGMPCLPMLKITGGLDCLIDEFYPEA